jgi:hypothetical protein
VINILRVDFRATHEPEWGSYSIKDGVEKWHGALHETIGYVAYWLAGRI